MHQQGVDSALLTAVALEFLRATVWRLARTGSVESCGCGCLTEASGDYVLKDATWEAQNGVSGEQFSERTAGSGNRHFLERPEAGAVAKVRSRNGGRNVLPFGTRRGGLSPLAQKGVAGLVAHCLGAMWSGDRLFTGLEGNPMPQTESGRKKSRTEATEPFRNTGLDTVRSGEWGETSRSFFRSCGRFSDPKRFTFRGFGSGKSRKCARSALREVTGHTRKDGYCPRGKWTNCGKCVDHSGNV